MGQVFLDSPVCQASFLHLLHVVGIDVRVLAHKLLRAKDSRLANIDPEF